jgi:hypothetical protein
MSGANPFTTRRSFLTRTVAVVAAAKNKDYLN